MNTISSHQQWWSQLEPQWQQAFGQAILKHFNEPTPAELKALLNLQTIRLAGPTAPFPNLSFELTNLSGLSQLTNLSIVIVTHHAIDNIEALSTLTGLKSLFLMNNAIASLSGIEAMKDLEQLYVQSNKISSIQPIEALVHIKELYINDNMIDSLQGLTEAHADHQLMLICRPNILLKQKEIIRVERELGIICKGLA